MIHTMPRYTAASLEFEKLKLEESTNSPSRRRGMAGKSSQSSHRRRAAASNQSSSSAVSHSSRVISTSGAGPSAGPSGRELRPSTRNQGVTRGDSDSDEEEEEEDSEEDNRNNDSDADDTGNDNPVSRNEESALLSSSLHFRELLACCTDNHLTSVQLILPTEQLPEGLSELTYVRH